MLQFSLIIRVNMPKTLQLRTKNFVLKTLQIKSYKSVLFHAELWRQRLGLGEKYAFGIFLL